jgi:phosphatidylserine/phosphatidylglycerophosphate/cardiolipin synthase-like enzyme
MADDSDYLFTGSSPNIPIFTGNRITPLIDGQNFALELATVLNLATGQGDFIFIHSWCLALRPGKYKKSRYAPWAPAESGARIDETSLDAFNLVINGQSRDLADVLKEKARAGVDVRILGWVSPLGMGSGFAEAVFFDDYAPINALTVNAIQDLRKEPAIGPKAALDTLGHAAGATHLKMWVVGNVNYAVAFTGGLDLVQNRFSSNAHDGDENTDLWHDIVAKVEGPAVQSCYDAFAHMWNLNASRPASLIKFEGQDVPSVMPDTPSLPAATLSTETIGNHRVQSLRTIPAANYTDLNFLKLPAADPTAPTGLFEVRAAWRKAIMTADTYIYMEDQSFWSREVMNWINTRLKDPNAPDLKVILLFPGRGDPNDPQFATSMFLNESINNSLLAGLDTAAMRRVRVFQRWGPNKTFNISVLVLSQTGTTARLQTSISGPFPLNVLSPAFIISGSNAFPVTGNPAALEGQPLLIDITLAAGATPPSGNVQLLKTFGVTVHSKTTLIDDRWAIIGSANCMRRSLYTDWEHSVAFVDDSQVPNSQLAVAHYRQTLWNEHFKHDNPDDFADIQSSLHSWEANWGTSGGAAPPLPNRPPGDPGTPPFLLPLSLPFPSVPISTDAQQEYDAYEDVDSNMTWGGICDLLRAKT